MSDEPDTLKMKKRWWFLISRLWRISLELIVNLRYENNSRHWHENGKRIVQTENQFPTFQNQEHNNKSPQKHWQSKGKWRNCRIGKCSCWINYSFVGNVKRRKLRIINNTHFTNWKFIFRNWNLCEASIELSTMMRDGMLNWKLATMLFTINELSNIVLLISDSI